MYIYTYIYATYIHTSIHTSQSKRKEERKKGRKEGNVLFNDALNIWRLTYGKGVITPNQIPLTNIVTYLQKSYRSRISNHWATILVCSVVPPITNSPRKHTVTYHFTDLQWQPSDSHKMSFAIFTPTPYINKWQISLCDHSSDTKSY